MNAQRVGPEWRKIRWYDRMSRRVIASNLRKLQVLAFSKLPLMSWGNSCLALPQKGCEHFYPSIICSLCGTLVLTGFSNFLCDSTWNRISFRSDLAWLWYFTATHEYSGFACKFLQLPVIATDGTDFSLWGSGEWWMLLSAQSMAIGTVMVRWVSKFSDPVMATGWVSLCLHASFTSFIVIWFLFDGYACVWKFKINGFD